MTFIFLLDANNGFFRSFAALGEGTGFLVFLLLPEKAAKKIFVSAADKAEKAFLNTRKALYFRREKRKEKKAVRADRKKTKKIR